MRVFITGASGWIGSAVSTELITAGHTVSGLARSYASAAKLEAAGVAPHVGHLRDLDALRAGATAADAVIHLGFIHDFAAFEESGRVERAAVEVFGDTLAGTDKPFLVASGLGGQSTGVITEDEPSPFHGPDSMRGGSENLALDYADQGVRTVALRFARTVHGQGDPGFAAALVAIARTKGISAYIGDGVSHWPAVHRADAAQIVRLALEQAPPRTVVHAVAEEGVPTRAIAEAIGASLGVPAQSIDPADADEHFGWLGRFFGMDTRASSTLTQQRFGWTPTHPTLLEDLAVGAYGT